MPRGYMGIPVQKTSWVFHKSPKSADEAKGRLGQRRESVGRLERFSGLAGGMVWESASTGRGVAWQPRRTNHERC